MSLQFYFQQVEESLQDSSTARERRCMSTGDVILSPCFRVDVVPVHVVHQAVLVVAKRLVSPVDEHAAAGLVVHAAVAVTSLDHRASGRHDLPRVRP